jgi:AcrR family transcriptional regulator
MARMKSSSQPAKTAEVTRQRLLGAAEVLFLEHGFDGTPLRLLTSKAGVNLAAVNYHFGGKDELFRAMLAARLDPLNHERIALLTEYEKAATGRALPCEIILNALFIPTLKLAREAKEARGRSRVDFLRLLGRAYVDPSPVLRQFLSERYAPMITRFKQAFGRALPQFPKRELSWRLHFMMGALAYTLAGTDAWKLIAALNPEESENDLLLLRRLAPFLIAGLQAPLPHADFGEIGGTLPRAPSITKRNGEIVRT